MNPFHILQWVMIHHVKQKQHDTILHFVNQQYDLKVLINPPGVEREVRPTCELADTEEGLTIFP
jgi:hypothetical protein